MTERKRFYTRAGVWIALIILLIVISMLGCSSFVRVIEEEKGIVFKSNKGFTAKYKKGEIEAEADTKSPPLIDLTLPKNFELP